MTVSYFDGCTHRLNMEVDLQILFGLHVTWCAQLCSLAETPQLPPSPRIWTRITRALLVSKDRRHLFVTPLDVRYCRLLCRRSSPGSSRWTSWTCCSPSSRWRAAWSSPGPSGTSTWAGSVLLLKGQCHVISFVSKLCFAYLWRAAWSSPDPSGISTWAGSVHVKGAVSWDFLHLIFRLKALLYYLKGADVYLSI